MMKLMSCLHQQLSLIKAPCNTLCLVALLITCSVAAQNDSSHYSTECSASSNEVQAKPPLLDFQPIEYPDISKELKHCVASSASVEERLNSERIRLIDIRDVGDQSSVVNQSVLKISKVALSKKQHWRVMPIALIGSGSSDDETLRSCAELRQLGFKDISVLPGGIQRLRDLSSVLKQQAPHTQPDFRVSPTTLIRSHQSVQWHFIDLSDTTEHPALKHSVERLNGIAERVYPERVGARLKSLVENDAEDSGYSRLNKKYVLTGMNEPSLSRLVEQTRRDVGAEVYYLQNVAQAIEAQKAALVAIQNYEPRLHQFGDCGSTS